MKGKPLDSISRTLYVLMVVLIIIAIGIIFAIELKLISLDYFVYVLYLGIASVLLYITSKPDAFSYFRHRSWAEKIFGIIAACGIALVLMYLLLLAFQLSPLIYLSP